MADGLEVVATRLLDALVGVDGGVARRASEVLAVLVGDVLALAVFEALGEPEVNDVDLVFSLVRSADQEVVRLNVAVDDPLLVHLLDAHQLNIYRLARSGGIFEMEGGTWPANSKLTICLAISRTVLRSNYRLQD